MIIKCDLKFKSWNPLSDPQGWIKYLSWEDELYLTGEVVLRKRRRYCLLGGISSCLFEEQDTKICCRAPGQCGDVAADVQDC